MKEVLPPVISILPEDLAKTLRHYATDEAAMVLKVLKEASVRQQMFEQVAALRDAEKAVRSFIIPPAASAA